MSMFCFQCEQTAGGTGCTVSGVCGKSPVAADLQDMIVQGVKKIGFFCQELREGGKPNREAERLMMELLFATVTNVNFHEFRLYTLFQKAVMTAERLKTAVGTAFPGNSPVERVSSLPAVPGVPVIEINGRVRIPRRKETLGEDVLSLQELLTYGLKGTAAYTHHAAILGKEADEIYAFFAKALSALAKEETSVEKLVGLVLECGKVNLRAMELLDAGHTERFGHPEPTAVRITHRKGKAILVSGHDLPDLEDLLKQTAGQGISVYTHGEMLPAHGYPELKKYSHLAGNYGGAWQDQRKEFAEFPGAILMTTNCMQNPRGYEKRIFTTGCVAYEGVAHIADRRPGEMKDFTPVMEAALAEPGFSEGELPEKTILVGFGRRAVMNVAEKVIDAVKAGKIRHFFLIGGCDGAKSGRNYYTELAERVPADCVILTLACGKYRFHKLEFGDIDGIPRLLDVGQCNDAYSAIMIASALADAFGTDVNSLPLSMILSWYEQKAVCILLTLLALGIKNIKLGPSLPAFVSPAVLNVLAEKFSLGAVSSAEEDLRAVLGVN